MKDITKHYTNGEVTIVWKPSLCIHSRLCWNDTTGLPEVFNPRIKPWINPLAASTEKMIEHVGHCPSGALSYFMNDAPETSTSTRSEIIVETILNGPLMVYGNITVKDKDGHETQKDKVTAFCRCGASANKPYCDGSHIKAGFQG